MRIRTGHGPNDWTTNTPSEPRSERLGGSAVISGPGSHAATTARANEQQRVAKAKARAAQREAV